MAFPSKSFITAYRIADLRHPIFDGTGAAFFGGRWNSQGKSVIYASESLAGAMLEKLAQTGIGSIPSNQYYIKIFILDELVIECVASKNLAGWNSPSKETSRQYGDLWLEEKRSPILKVPSIVVREDSNFVINPAHEQFKDISASTPEPIEWDKRIFKL